MRKFLCGLVCLCIPCWSLHAVDIQSIVRQWTGIEQAFFSEPAANSAAEGSATESSLLNDVDAFYDAVQSFQKSETYRIYRLILLSSAGHSEIPEIRKVTELIPVFREAIEKNDTEKSVFLANEISIALMHVMALEGEVERYTGGAYIRLFLVFIVFIVFTAVVIRLLYQALTRSLKREAEGSVFSHAVLLAQEDERARLSRELHDTIAQDLRYLSLEMDKIARTPDVSEREKLCADAALMQSGLIVKVREICDYLVPPDFRFQGLLDALRRLCLDFGKRTGIDCRIDIMENVNVNSLCEEKQLQVFRIVQEALTNVGKHAQAQEAIVTLRTSQESSDGGVMLFLGISDDGKGFSFVKNAPNGNESFEKHRHMGIRGMNERAALLGGTLEIKSEQGEGTLVKLQVPIV